MFDYYIRILIAAICGGVIGVERRTRLKEAGIRTHVIVAIGSCLIMVVSKYGFNDIVQTELYKVDAARLAAQVVSGVGFLGAGMILIRKNVISGLTTAAGIWTTSGIGLAIGSGMYQLGIYCTALIIIFQYFMHAGIPGIGQVKSIHLTIEVDEKKHLADLQHYLEDKGIKIQDIQFETNNRAVEVNYSVRLPKGLNVLSLTEDLGRLDYILSVENM